MLRYVLFTAAFVLCKAAYLNNELEGISSPNGLAKSIRSYLKSNSYAVSEPCLSQIFYYAGRLEAKDPWALKMFDATSKLPSGFFTGNWADLGAFDQCLEVQDSASPYGEIKGKYCLGGVNISSPISLLWKINRTEIVNIDGGGEKLRWAICFPDVCSVSDIQEFFLGLHLEQFSFTDEGCQTLETQPGFEGGDIAFVSVLGVAILMVITSTLYDAYITFAKKEPLNPLLLAFSVKANAPKIFDANEEDESRLYCLRGIRAVSMLWVMLGHRYIIMWLMPHRNSADIPKWLDNTMVMFFMNSTLAADSFLLVSGTLVSYRFLKADKDGIQFNIFKYYIHRYLRLTSILAVVIAVHLTIFKHLNWGPVWPELSKSQFIEGCQEYWWTTLLYVQNYVHQPSLCVNDSWYLAIDFQLFLLSPLILLPLRKWPRLTLSLVGVLALCSILTSFLVGWFYEIRALLVNNVTPEERQNFLQLYYMTTHTRATPWLIGIIVGYFVYKSKYERRICPKIWMVIVCWVCVDAVLLGCLFAGGNFVLNEYDRVGNSLHLALVRPSWALAVGWVVFACSTGFGGVVNSLLSLQPFDLLSKLSYGIYLIHFTEMAVVSGAARASVSFVDIDANIVLGGDVPVSIVLTLALMLAFESPILAIEKHLLPRKQANKSNPLITD